MTFTMLDSWFSKQNFIIIINIIIKYAAYEKVHGLMEDNLNFFFMLN